MSKSRKILHKLLFGDYFSCKLHDLCISLQMLNTIFILLHCKYNETVHVRKCDYVTVTVTVVNPSTCLV